MGQAEYSRALGIDFGTSNSAIGVTVNGKPTLIEIENGRTTLPTSVFFDSQYNVIRYGSAANRSLIEREEGRFMRAMKSVLGTSLMHEKRYLLGERITFVDVIARFLSEIKARAETQLDRGFDYALSGRPVHFHSDSAEKDRKALDDLTLCYKTAGFKGVDFLFEPEAAAIANGGLAKDEIALIVDIGGGTSDFCLFKNAGENIDVLASSGVRVGGTDFDKCLNVEHVMPLLGHGEMIKKEMGPGTLSAPNTIFRELASWERIPSLYTKKSRNFAEKLHKLALNKQPFSRLNKVLEDEFGHDIAFAVEQGKIEANKIGTSNIDLTFIENQLHVALTNKQVDQSLSTLAEKISTCALETVAMADFSADKVDRVIFVGGSSLMSVVEQTVAPHFPNAVLEYSDAFTAIVDGLTIAANR